jgi:hypothetical protein
LQIIRGQLLCAMLQAQHSNWLFETINPEWHRARRANSTRTWLTIQQRNLLRTLTSEAFHGHTARLRHYCWAVCDHAYVVEHTPDGFRVMPRQAPPRLASRAGPMANGLQGFPSVGNRIEELDDEDFILHNGRQSDGWMNDESEESSSSSSHDSMPDLVSTRDAAPP